MLFIYVDGKNRPVRSHLLEKGQNLPMRMREWVKIYFRPPPTPFLNTRMPKQQKPSNLRGGVKLTPFEPHAYGLAKNAPSS